MNTNNQIFATLPMRIKAFTIDIFVLALLFILISYLATIITDNILISKIIIIFPLFLIEPIMLTICGCSVGKYLIGIKVIRKNDYSTVPFIASLLRFPLKIVFAFFSLLFVSFGLSKKHQMLHDYIANTIVVLSKKKISKNPIFANKGILEIVYDNYFKLIARTSWKCAVISILLMLFSKILDELDIYIGMIASIFNVVGVILGIVAIIALIYCRQQNILGHAVLGVFLNVTMLCIFPMWLWFYWFVVGVPFY